MSDPQVNLTKLIALVCAVWFVLLCPSRAISQENRFHEAASGNDINTLTYDYSTVQLIQPGRFTIIGTTIDNPDFMRLELQVLYTMRTYCARPAGKYPGPDHVFKSWHPPDMPINIIEIIRYRGGRGEAGDGGAFGAL